MRLVTICCVGLVFFSTSLFGFQSNSRTPGALMTSRTETELKVLMSESHNSVYGENIEWEKTPVLTCTYRKPSQAPSDFTGVLHLWLGPRPSWVEHSKNKASIDHLITGSATQCPPTLPAYTVADTTIPPAQNSRSKTALAKEGGKPPTADGIKDSALTPTSLRTDGMHFADSIKAIYIGDFAHAKMVPTGLEFPGLLSSYMEAYSNSCSAYLPLDKLPITQKGCAVYRQPTNKYGAPVGVRTCAQPTRTPIPGQFADPDVFDAYLSIEDSSDRNAVIDLTSLLSSSDPAASVGKNVGNMAATLKAAQEDMRTLIRLNGCRSPSMKRMQDNMVRFAEDKQAISMAGVVIEASDVPLANQLDVVALAGDLIRADSANWTFNRFEGGVALAAAPEVDGLGRLHKVTANYDNSGLIRARQSVVITFSGGIPSCLYFADDSKTCDRPDPKVIKAYSSGQYKTKNASSTAVASVPPQSLGAGVWKVHHSHASRDSNGRDVSATASWPAINKFGKTIGSLDVAASCTMVVTSLRVSLIDAPGYELAQMLHTSDLQANSRVALFVSLNGGTPSSTVSLDPKSNRLEIDFKGPGFDKGQGSAQGAVYLAQLVNGSKFMGTADELYKASSLKLGIPVSHGGTPDFLQLTIDTQNSAFKSFTTACQHLDPANQLDPETELAQRTEVAAKLLTPAQTTELRSIVAHLEDGYKTSNRLFTDESYSQLIQKFSSYPMEHSCSLGDEHACSLNEAMADLRDQFIVLGLAVEDKTKEARRAAHIVPAGTHLKYTLSNKIMADQFVRGTLFNGTLSAPVTNDSKVVLEQGSVVHFSGFTSGNIVRLYAKELIKDGKTLPLSTSQCELPMKSDSSSIARGPGSRPFNVNPANSAPQYAAASTECSVVLMKPLSLP